MKTTQIWSLPHDEHLVAGRSFATDLTSRWMLVAALLASSGDVFAVEVTIEAGPSVVVANRLQRPMNSGGTRFEATDYTGRGVTPWRVEAGWDDAWWGRGGVWQAAYVPLRSAGDAIPTTNVTFDGGTFLTGQPLRLRYQFDTWRLAYSEPVGTSWSGAWEWRLGTALAVRSARIRLLQGATVRQFNNVGPVPLARIEVSRLVGASQRMTATFEGFPAPGGGGLFDGAVRWAVQVAPSAEAGLFFREQAGAAVDRAIFNRLQVRSWGAVLSGRF